jgi:hypothetical protein
VQLAGKLEAKRIMAKTIPPLITPPLHDGGLPSPLSYTLANDNPPLPSMPTQRSRQNLRERLHFQNDGWTKWEAVQLTDKFEAKQAMEKADWECWKKLEEGFKQFRGLLLFDLVDDDQQDAHRDERIRQRWTVELSQNGQEMDMSPYSSLSPSPQQCGSCTKTSAQRKQKGKRRKRTGKTVSFNVGSDEKLIKEEAEDACARPHSGIRLSVINEVNKDSIEEDYEDEGSREEDINTESNNSEGKKLDCVRTGSGGFFVSSPNNDYKGGIDSMIGGSGPIDPQSLCGIGNNDGVGMFDCWLQGIQPCEWKGNGHQ